MLGSTSEPSTELSPTRSIGDADAESREQSVLWPLVAMALVMGIFPGLWMNSIHASVTGILDIQNRVLSPTLQVKVNTVLK